MKSKERKQPRTSTVLLFALIIFILGIYLIFYNYLVSKKEKIYSSMNLLLFKDETPSQVEKIKEKEDKNTTSLLPTQQANNQQVNTQKVSYNYIGTIEITKIKLKRGFLDITSPYNTVSRNVTVINQSTFPNVDKGNLILAAHSGNCSICYFDKLYKLSVGDKAYVVYKKYKYTYILKNIYNVLKTGQVEIKRNPDKTVLTLITCTHNSDTQQTVYIFELDKKVKD